MNKVQGVIEYHWAETKEQNSYTVNNIDKSQNNSASKRSCIKENNYPNKFV